MIIINIIINKDKAAKIIIMDKNDINQAKRIILY